MQEFIDKYREKLQGVISGCSRARSLSGFHLAFPSVNVRRMCVGTLRTIAF